MIEGTRAPTGATKNDTDPQRYRVSLICACLNELVYGYGPTLDDARARALDEFRKHNPRAKIHEEIAERVTPDGTHYEELCTHDKRYCCEHTPPSGRNEIIEDGRTWTAFPEVGAWLHVHDPHGSERCILNVPMLVDGEPERHTDGTIYSAAGEVSDPCGSTGHYADAKRFLDAVNAHYGTHFTPEPFGYTREAQS